MFMIVCGDHGRTDVAAAAGGGHSESKEEGVALVAALAEAKESSGDVGEEKASQPITTAVAAHQATSPPHIQIPVSNTS